MRARFAAVLKPGIGPELNNERGAAMSAVARDWTLYDGYGDRRS